MARSSSSGSRGMSFQELSARVEAFDDWEDAEEEKKPRRNPFSDDFGALDIADSTWVSQKEVADFMKQSRRLTLSDDDDEKDLGPAWGGLEYSLDQGKPRADSARTGPPQPSVNSRSGSTTANQPRSSSFEGKPRTDSAPKSVRTQPPQPSVNSASGRLAANQPRSSSFEAPKGPKGQTPPPKRPSTPSPSVQRSRTSKSSSLTSVDPSSTPLSSSPTTHVSAAAVRNQTPKVPTTQAALQSVSSSIKDVISSTPQVSVTEYNKLQAEIKQLRRDLQATRKDKSAVPSAQETVKKIIRGQPYTLEVYKSLKDKLALLDCAIKMHDGNAITAAVLFLKKTVKQRILYNELKTCPKAVQHLCKYLSEHYDYTELTDLYRSVGKFEEAAMLQFQQAIKKTDPGVRLTNLKYILRNYFEGHQQLAEQTIYVKEYIDLLEQQIAIEETDARAELERKNHVMVSHPRQASLPLNSLIVTLYYCCRYHFGEPENVLSSPLAIRARFKLSDKQYEWTALSARAKLKQWRGLEQMFNTKGWFGSVKMKSVIGFAQVVELLHQHAAPEQVLNTYLRLIDDLNQRVSLATKTKCHSLVIETLVAIKDRQQLEKYRSQLKGTAPEQAKISEYLNNSQIRWKN